MDLDQRKCCNLAGVGGHIQRDWDGRIKTPCGLAQSATGRCDGRQRKMADRLKFAQRLDAPRSLSPATGVDKAEVVARGLSKSGPCCMRPVGQQSPDNVNRLRLRQSPLELVLCFHSGR